MGYVGNEPSVNFTSFAKQDITGNGGANYTLTHAVANANEIEVFVNNVRQEPTSAYSVSGTALTMTGNVASTDDFYVIYLGKALQTTVPPDGSVTNAKIVNSTIDLTSKVTGILPVANGGSGQSTQVPCFSATFSSPLNSNTNNTAVKVRFNSTTFNQGGGTFDTSNYRYTPGVSGIYMFGTTVNMKDSGDNNNLQQQNVSIRKNGSDVLTNRIQLASQSGDYGLQGSAYNAILTVTGLLQMDTDDYVEVWGSCYNANFDLRPEFSRFYGFKLIGTT